MIEFKNITTAELILTSTCNLKCPYCFEGEKNKTNFMSEETIKITVDELIKNALAKNEISIPAFASKRYHVTKDRLSFLENL